jgi:hypothetical protein
MTVSIFLAQCPLFGEEKERYGIFDTESLHPQVGRKKFHVIFNDIKEVPSVTTHLPPANTK